MPTNKKQFFKVYLPLVLSGLLIAGAGLVFFRFSQNKNSQNLTAPENYSVKGQSYGQVINHDPSQKLEIKIGSTEKLQPSFSLIKWDGEAALTMTPDLHQTVLDSQKSLTQTDNKFVYKNGQKEEVHMYGLPKSSLNPEGGYEIEWVLNEKPSGNVFNFNLETTGLEYYFQPPLTEEFRPGEVCTQTECRKNGKITRARAENVIGSYAVYAAGKKDNYKDLGGKNYGTGKVGHIYRPLIIDNSGKKIWAKLNIDKQSKLLSVNVPREFLDSASYPVIVDPTFGYTTVGASEDTSTFIQNSYVLAQSNPTTNGTLTSISTYGRNGGSGRIDCALYSNKAGPLPDARLAFNDLGPTIDNVSGWDDCPLVYSGLTSGTQYWLAYQEEYVNYDSGSGALRYNPLTGAANWPAVADDTSTFNAIWSVYGTYTSAAPITVKGGFKILGGGDGYLLSESFEGSSACGDGVGTNCNLTWTLVNTPVTTFNYTTSPAPLEGTNSLLIGVNNANAEGIKHSFSAQNTVYFFLIMNHKVLVGGNGNETFILQDGSNNDLFSISNANPEWRVACGSVFNNTADAIVQGTTYYVWGDYTKGTGSNAVCNLYYSTTSTKPGSPNLTISNGDSTAQASVVELLNSDTASQTIYDKVLINSSSIGSNPSVRSGGNVKFK